MANRFFFRVNKPLPNIIPYLAQTDREDNVAGSQKAGHEGVATTKLHPKIYKGEDHVHHLRTKLEHNLVQQPMDPIGVTQRGQPFAFCVQHLERKELRRL